MDDDPDELEDINPMEVDDDDDDADTSSYFETPFTEERLHNVHRLRSTPYKEECKGVIESTTLYPRTKKALYGLVDQFLSEMSILSNYPGGEMALLDYDIAVLGMKHSYYPTDLKNPMLFHILTLVRTHYKAILTRAQGEDRERILNGRESIENRTVKATQDPIMVKRQPKRKGIFGF